MKKKKERIEMKILVVGDIVGRPGRKTLKSYLEKYKENYDFIIVNGENAAAGFGITEKIAVEFLSWGIDIITGGNHTWDKKEFYTFLNQSNRVIRPCNYPEGVPGLGYSILPSKKGKKVAVLSLQGRVFMPATDCPFRVAEKVLSEIQEETNIIIVDFHAEASSEKIALGWFLDGKVSTVYGTHTHIQTADEKILPQGTSYITDVGMTGSENGVIGMKVECILPKFLTALPQRFEVAEGNEMLHGIALDIEEDSGKTIQIERIAWREE